MSSIQRIKVIDELTYSLPIEECTEITNKDDKCTSSDAIFGDV